jgi:chemotaxis protein MotA
MALVGLIIVVVAVLGGFIIAKGNPLLLLQPAEFIVIGGAAAGSLVIMSKASELKEIFAILPKLFKPAKGQKQENLDILKTLFDFFVLAQKDGIIAIERHIEKPDQSEILSKNHLLMNNPFISAFFCDTLKLILSGVNPQEVEMILDQDIETYEDERKGLSNRVAVISESFPGLGIVAAVLGVILTMKSISEGAEAVGEHIAAALVGTFLGVLLCYGVVGPLATLMEHHIEEEIRLLRTIKGCIVSYSKGYSPIIAVELARRTIQASDRPTFQELESFVRGKR